MASFSEAANVGLGAEMGPNCDFETEIQALRRQLAQKNKELQHLTRQLQAEKNANTWLDREKVATYQGERDDCRPTSPRDDDDEDDPNADYIKEELVDNDDDTQPPSSSPLPHGPTNKGKASAMNASKRRVDDVGLSGDDEASRKEADSDSDSEGDSFLDTKNIVTSKRKRARVTGMSTLALKDKFEFLPITNYCDDDPGHVVAFDSSNDLYESEPRFSKIFEPIYEQWEESKGECWADYIQGHSGKFKVGQPTTRQCVTTKLAGQRTQWRSDGEGRYACRKCVQKRWPCFTWNVEEEEFWLLPLHPEDMVSTPREDQIVRFWVNAA